MMIAPNFIQWTLKPYPPPTRARFIYIPAHNDPGRSYHEKKLERRPAYITARVSRVTYTYPK